MSASLNCPGLSKDAQGGGGEVLRGDETGPPRQIFKKLVNKNANPKYGTSPSYFVLKALTPRDFGENLS
jgi:hypothetical protein